MTKGEILNFLESNKQFMNENFGVLKMGLFGSYARNNFSTESDIDILVELKEQKYDLWVSLKLFLEKAFNKRVDVIANGNYLRQSFLDTINREIIYV